MLGRLQMTVADALKQYDVVGSEVFQRGRKVTWKGRLAPRFKSRHLESALQKITRKYGHDGAQETNDPPSPSKTTFKQNGKHGAKAVPPAQARHVKNQADRVLLRNGNVDSSRTYASIYSMFLTSQC